MTFVLSEYAHLRHTVFTSKPRTVQVVLAEQFGRDSPRPMPMALAALRAEVPFQPAPREASSRRTQRTVWVGPDTEVAAASLERGFAEVVTDELEG